MEKMEKEYAQIIIKIAIVMYSIALFIAILRMPMNANARPVENLQNTNLEYIYNLHSIDTSSLTLDKIINRNGKMLVERVIGRVINSNKDGQVLNHGKNTEYNYISYKGVDCSKGNTVVTYVFYNPNTNYSDDIIARWDYVIR